MSCVVCVSIISRVDKKRERPTAAAAAQGVGRAGGQSYMFGIYGNLPTSAILDIFHSERGQRREKKLNSLLFFVFFFTPYSSFLYILTYLRILVPEINQCRYDDTTFHKNHNISSVIHFQVANKYKNGVLSDGSATLKNFLNVE